MTVSRLCPALTWALVAWLALVPAEALAQSLALSNMVVDNQSGRVTVRFGVEVKGVEALQEVLQEHRALGLQCRAQLLRKRDYAWNREIVRTERTWVVSLEDDGRTYSLVRDDGQGERVRGRDLKLLLRQTWTDLTIDLGPWSSLERGESYAVILELRLMRRDVSGLARTTLFFWSFDAAQAAKYQLDFTY